MENLIPLIAKYKALDLQNVIDHDKFNQYAIVHHSSGIEGSTLTETETRLLLEEGTTPKGKPLAHSLMVKDHFEALQFVLNSASEKHIIDVEFIQAINAKVMKSTGSAGGSYFVNFDKVVGYTERLVLRLKEQMEIENTIPEQLQLSFVAHFDLVSIHPFYDGNERTSRLLMNFIQAYFKLPLAIVYQEDKKDYYDALVASRKAENTVAFEAFMQEQYEKFLTLEMEQFEKDMSKDLPQNKKHWPGSGFSIFFS